ncbi:hypothetical protein HAHE_28550 [Haloferula helveola]|uniref:Uncharacterized protein n=1 Tax=Haloferula helveola TaxID=490095 RepID=A0ABM7RFR4_9BACT|nr:hypothetical protein HAHE_28550 [Haloferula helveola]
MRRSIAYPLALLTIGGFFALTLFRTVSLTVVWEKDSLVPLEGASFAIVGRNGALEFETGDIFFLGKPKTKLSWDIEEAENHQPFWLPRTYERAMYFTRAWELRYPEGIRIPLWPFILLILLFWLRPGKKRKS